MPLILTQHLDPFLGGRPHDELVATLLELDAELFPAA